VSLNRNSISSCLTTCNFLLNSISEIPSRAPESPSRTICGYTSLRAEKSPHWPQRATMSAGSRVVLVIQVVKVNAIDLFVSDAKGLTIWLTMLRKSGSTFALAHKKGTKRDLVPQRFPPPPSRNNFKFWNWAGEDVIMGKKNAAICSDSTLCFRRRRTAAACATDVQIRKGTYAMTFRYHP
jgi:hypothetical protein